MSILLNFQWGFRCLSCEKRTKVLAGFLCLWIWTWSQAYPIETLAHFRVTHIARSINELGWQLWRGRFKSLFVWWSTGIWIGHALIFCLQNMWSYHRAAQLKHRQQCLVKEERSCKLYWGPLAEWGEMCGTSTLAQALYFSYFYYFCKEYIEQCTQNLYIYILKSMYFSDCKNLRFLFACITKDKSPGDSKHQYHERGGQRCTSPMYPTQKQKLL